MTLEAYFTLCGVRLVICAELNYNCELYCVCAPGPLFVCVCVWEGILM